MFLTESMQFYCLYLMFSPNRTGEIDAHFEGKILYEILLSLPKQTELRQQTANH